MSIIRIVRVGDEKFAISDKEWGEVGALLKKHSRFRTYTVTAANKSSVQAVLRMVIQSMKGEIVVIDVTGPDNPECRISFQRIVDPDPAAEEAFELHYRALATSSYVKSCDPPPKQISFEASDA